jgi:Ceramidase
MEKGVLLHIYGLCERESDSLLAEPMNVLTNLAFIVTATFLWRECRANHDLRGYKIYDIKILIALIFLIGICSSLFHIYPTPTTELIDTIVIAIFIICFLISVLIRIVKCKIMETFVCFMAYAGFTHILVTQFPNGLNGSIAYLSTMSTLIFIALYLNLKRRATARAFMLAAIIGVISLFFRSIDNAVCDKIPVGTHFLWHTLNALLIYIVMMQLIRNVNRRARMLREANLHYA